MVDDKLLGFYHFTGFDSGDHKIMAIKNSRNNPTVKELVGWYEAQNKVLKKDKLNKLTWSYGQYSDGTPIIKTHRLIYRDRIDLQKAFSDPFASEGYLTWLNAQGVKEYKCLNGKLNQGDQTLGDFTSHLTLGFSPQSTFSFSKVAYSLKQALKNPINSIRKIRNKSNVINKFYT